MHRLHAIKFISSLPAPQVVRVCRLIGGTVQCIFEMNCAADGDVRWRAQLSDFDIVAPAKDDIIVTGEGTTTCYWDDDYPVWMW